MVATVISLTSPSWCAPVSTQCTYVWHSGSYKCHWLWTDLGIRTVVWPFSHIISLSWISQLLFGYTYNKGIYTVHFSIQTHDIISVTISDIIIFTWTSFLMIIPPKLVIDNFKSNLLCQRYILMNYGITVQCDIDLYSSHTDIQSLVWSAEAILQSPAYSIHWGYLNTECGIQSFSHSRASALWSQEG